MPEVALVTDSASYIPANLLKRAGILLVPLHVHLAGTDYAEPDIDSGDFYTRLTEGASVSTSQPSPGDFMQVYKQMAGRGASQILSVHIGSNLSGTVQSARLAADSSPIPVTIVDTGQASFAQGLCVLEAAEALARGAPIEEAAALAEAASRAIGNTFVVRAMELVQRSGRLAAGENATTTGVPVMGLTPEGLKVLASATTLDEAVETMAEHVQGAAKSRQGCRLRVGIGHGAAPDVAAALRDRVMAMPEVEEIIEYIVGPAIGAHVGPGNAGAVFLPRPVTLE